MIKNAIDKESVVVMKIKKAMVIDDSESDQFLACNEIRKFDENIEILQAYDGVEALEILTSLDEQPDVVFLDINMPRMNGLEFLDEYSKLDQQSPVIAMLTSSDQEQDKDRALSYMCVKDYFQKLLKLDDLEKIQHVIKETL